MRLRDIFRRKQPVNWSADTPDDAVSILRPGLGKGQRSGRIYAPRTNEDWPVSPDDNNRAGHRLYVKVNQPRQFRINVVGFGRWRRPLARKLYAEYGTHAANTADPFTLRDADRRLFRPHQVYLAKQNRKAGLRPGWRRP